MCHVVSRDTGRENVMSTQSREAPTMLQHSTDPRYVQRLFGCQCQCVCVRAFAQVCVMSHAYWRSSLGIPQRKRAVCRRAPADDNSEEKCHENATFDTFNCNCITQVPTAIIREWKKRQGKKLLKHVHLLSWPLVATQNNWRKRKYAYNVCPDGLWPIGGSTDPANE